MTTPISLTVSKGNQDILSKSFEQDIIKIGRSPTAHVTVEAENEKVARIHAVIDIDSDGVISITHMGSEEGTFVNGRRISKAVLVMGDEIVIGGSTLRLAPAEADRTSIMSVQTAQAPVLRSASVAAGSVPVSASAAVSKRSVQDETTGARVRGRTSRKAGSGPLGLEIRMMWGDRIVAEHFLPPNKPASFTVGSKAGVNFVMGEQRLGESAFEAVKVDAAGFVVRFTQKMSGEIHRKGGQEVVDLKTAISEGQAVSDGGAYAVSVRDDEFVWVDLGGIVLEASLQPVPKPVIVPYWETIDFTALNIFLGVFFVAALFVVQSLILESEKDGLSDDLSGDQARMAKLLVKPAEKKKNPFLERMEKKKDSGEMAAKRKGTEGDMGKKNAPKVAKRTAPKGDPSNKDQARMMTSTLFGGKGGGLSTVFGKSMGGELTASMGKMFGPAAGDAAGMGGMGLRGAGGGGGGAGDTIGIGGVGTKGKGGGMGNYGNGAGGIGRGKGTDLVISDEGATVNGSLDKELIRQVIHRNRGQIRYCYESQLSRYPNLNGKVAIRFVISASGSVAQSSVAQSTVNNSELENCVAGRVRTFVFPKPNGGGAVIVTYPFIFKQSGE